MAVTLTINGVNYSFPTTGDESWGGDVTGWATAVSNGTLQPNATSFVLTGGDLDFGNAFGLKPQYIISRTANPASAGNLRLANIDLIQWRNNANSGNLTFGVDTSDRLVYNGIPIVSSSGIVPATAGGTGFSSYTVGDMLYANSTTTLAKLGIGPVNEVQVSTGSAPDWALLVNANIDPAAAIAYSKLNLTNSIVNADINSSAAIAYSKLNLTGSINLASDVTGTLPIANGGTGQTTQTAAFDALAPSTTKGDLIVHNGTDNIRVAVGSNGQVLQADSTTASGVKWASSSGTPVTGFFAYASADQALNASDTALTVNTVDFDTNSGYNTGTAEYTIPTTGFWNFSAQMRVNGGGSAAEFRIIFYKNGGTLQEFNNSRANTTGWGMIATSNFSLVAGDVIKLYGFDSTGTGSTAAAGRGVFISGFLWK